MARRRYVGTGSKRIEAAVLTECLAALRKRSGHSPSDDDILSDAALPDSPLHGLFEWDDAVAARAHRQWQVANLLHALAVLDLRAQGWGGYGDPAEQWR